MAEVDDDDVPSAALQTQVKACLTHIGSLSAMKIEMSSSLGRSPMVSGDGGGGGGVEVDEGPAVDLDAAAAVERRGELAVSNASSSDIVSAFDALSESAGFLFCFSAPTKGRQRLACVARGVEKRERVRRREGGDGEEASFFFFFSRSDGSTEARKKVK